MKSIAFISSSPGKVPSTRTSLENPQRSTLTTIASELRLEIYSYLFIPAGYLLRRRAGVDDEYVIEHLAHTFDNNILFTCRQLYQEALPVFYVSQTFHHSLTTGGLSRIWIHNDEIVEQWDHLVPVREGPIPHFSNKLHLMVNLSLILEINDERNADAVLAKQIADFAQQCPRLRILTIHLIGCWYAPDFPANSDTGRALRQLRPRLESLNILGLHWPRGEKGLPTLRLSIADNKDWSAKWWSGKISSDQTHHGFPTGIAKWPYLTLPSLIQGHVGRACSVSSCSPPGIDRCIYKWTCPKEVEEGSGIYSPHPLGSWVLEPLRSRVLEVEE